jgi:D-alanyl-D-alanine carboxypeptidase (penicillin-binding protein 5/6)
MRNRSIVFIILFSAFILFNPGTNYYTDLFVNRPEVFSATDHTIAFQKNDIPVVINPAVIPLVSAQGVYIADLTSFSPVYKKNEHMHMLPASTTKVITALTAYDAFKLDDVLTVKRVVAEGQVVGVVKNEKLTFESLLYGLLVYSGNDIAYVLADNYPGGYDAFIEKMNKKAQELHMVDSHFINPAGLDAPGQYSSPFDLALAGRQLLQNKELAKIVSTKSITISDVDFNYFHELTNVNKLLGEIPGVGGLKTGYTEEAGENLISFYKRHGHQFLIVILKSDDRFADTTAVIHWIDGNVRFEEFKS